MLLKIVEERTGELVEEEEELSDGASVSSQDTVHGPSTNEDDDNGQWREYFSRSLYLAYNSSTFHVLFTPPKTPSSSLIVFHHGAGSSSLSFCLLVKHLQKLLPDAGFLAVDARGHGSVVCKTNGDGSESADFELESLSKDLAVMIDLVVEQELKWEKYPPIWLVGHSLGGAVVTQLADERTLGSDLMGVVVLDVVEGSAISALKGMRGLLASRPSKFFSIDDAVQWHLNTNALRNAESAKISVPGIIKENDKGEWVWKAPLEQTEPYWDGWFTGMSNRFLGVRGAKLLVLAGTDRLDKELMIGQMQGKFQLHVIPPSGHFVQEDEPEALADTLATFVERNDRSKLVLPMKVSEMLALGKKI